MATDFKTSNSAQRRISSAGGRAREKTDWATIERDYCTTHFSDQELADKHGNTVTRQAISKRAKQKGWVRPSKDALDIAPLELEARHQRFVEEYLNDPNLNGTQAYLRAFPGTPAKSARTLASRLLARVDVQEAIAAARERSAQRFGITRDRCLAEYAKLAFFDWRDAYHPNGALKLPHEMDGPTAAGILSYETIELPGGKDAPPALARKIKIVDRRGPLDSLMRAQGWNKADVGTPENPLVVRRLSDTERAVRLTQALQADPDLVTALMQAIGGGAD